MNTAAFFKGCQAAIPITLGYIPVGIAFGLACASAGVPAWAAICMSLFIYAGASQFLLLASITGGASVVAVVGLCALLDSRHLLYAPLIKRHLKPNQNLISAAPLITDEVFATALAKLDDVDEQKAWFWGVVLVAWVSWWGSTIVGVYGGKALSAYPLMSEVMNFAFVALFISLSTHAFAKHPTHRPVIILAAIVALIATIMGHGEMAILIAAGVAFAVSLLQSKCKAL
ncbi:MAG: AzlC family ABC transporter permease [Moraxella sp.]|nr:AzlC family ABC transporter permease [Moraxella sp.]